MTTARRLHHILADNLRAHISGQPMRVPEPCRPLWGWFTDLSAARTWHANGPNPIAYCEVEAYGRLAGVPFRPIDVRAIRDLDDAWLTATLARMKAGVSGVPHQPLNPAAFDAVFG